MDLKQLRALVTVAETGNVTRAAALLHLVQPAVSRQLRLLEEDLGTPLFERGPAGMQLTAAGEAMVDYARRILDEVARARAEIRPAGGALGGIVSLGLLASTAELLSSPLVTAVAQAHPGIRLRIVAGYAGDLLPQLERGALDAALLYDPKRNPALRVRPLLEEGLWVVGPPSARLRASRPLAMATAARSPLVLPSAPHGLRALIEQAAATAGVTLQAAAETNDLGVQTGLVRAGHGLTILPIVAVSRDVAQGTLCAAPLAEPEIVRKVVLASPSSRAPSAAVRSVLATLLAVMRGTVGRKDWPGARWVGD